MTPHSGERLERGLPRIALRRDPDGSLDDVVVENVEMFRAEMMSEQDLWLCCHLDNGESIQFWVQVDGGRKPLAFQATDVPPHEDWDAELPQEQER